jgi:hypothetical protein
MLVVAFVVFGFVSQLLLLAFFAAYLWRPARAGRIGSVVYGFGLLGAVVAIALLVNGQPWSLALGPALFALWSAFGLEIDVVRPIAWRSPPRWAILLPYAGLLMAALIALWVPLWFVDRALWVAFGILYAAHTTLNVYTHVSSGRRGPQAT